MSSIWDPKRFRVVKVHGHRTFIGVGLRVNQEYHNLSTDNSEMKAWERGGSRVEGVNGGGEGDIYNTFEQ